MITIIGNNPKGYIVDVPFDDMRAFTGSADRLSVGNQLDAAGFVKSVVQINNMSGELSALEKRLIQLAGQIGAAVAFIGQGNEVALDRPTRLVEV